MKCDRFRTERKKNPKQNFLLYINKKEKEKKKQNKQNVNFILWIDCVCAFEFYVSVVPILSILLFMFYLSNFIKKKFLIQMQNKNKLFQIVLNLIKTKTDYQLGSFHQEKLTFKNYGRGYLKLLQQPNKIELSNFNNS